MKKYFFGMMALAALAAGCASDGRSSANRGNARPGVLDITPLPSTALVASGQPVQPVQVASAQPVEQPAAPAAFNGPAGGGSSYTVQKGDTLYKIARERYGDGKQWQKIVAANPGVSPGTLKVGQKIAIP
jgi:5'-nucleotidase